MSEHVRVERRRRRAGDHADPARTAQRDHRRHVCGACRRDRGSRWRRFASPDHARGRRRGLHRRQRPRRLPGRNAARRVDDIPVWRLLERWPRTRCRSSPRCMAMPSASARPCCSTATSSLPRKARASSCRSSTWGWYRKRRARCFCRGSPGAAVPRATCCSARPFGPEEALEFGLVSHVAAEGELEAALDPESSPRCWPSRPRRCG